MPKILYNPLSNSFDYTSRASDFKGDFRPSSGAWHWVSSQKFSGGSFLSKTAPPTDFYLANKKYVDDAVIAGGGYTDEQAQDAVGNILTIGLTYDDAGNNIYVTNYIASSSAISRFADSSNIRLKYAGSSNIISRYAPSRAVRNGLQTITAAYGEISHGLPSTPSNWSIRPSGVLANFGINTKVDATKIYVYLTTMTNRNVYWYAST